MAEDNYEPFAEDYAPADIKPRVHRPYAGDKDVAPTKLRRRLRGVFSSGRNNLVQTGKALLVAFAILAYPIMTVLSHDVDDTPVELGDSRYWAVPDIGISSTLISRELDGPGWTSDLHPWHPQYRLTALPAWQDSLLEALADHGRLTISLLSNQRDQDLIAAVRLLEPVEGKDTTARLHAAIEALTRYDDRVAGGVTAAARGTDALIAKLDMTRKWANLRYAPLVDIASPGDGWIASSRAVETVYAAKATAHVAHEILAATALFEQSVLRQSGLEQEMQDALAKWRRAAALRPLLIVNQSGDAFSGLSHPAIMAFHLNEAQTATAIIIERLQNSAAQTPTEAKIELADSPTEP